MVEAIGSVGGPVAIDFDEEAARGGFEFDAEELGSVVVSERQKQQESVEQRGHAIQSTFGVFVVCDFRSSS
jgi:hypothetical protein